MRGLAAAIFLLLGACGSGGEERSVADPSKLDAEAEARAQAIERAADAAVVAAERDAGAALRNMEAEDAQSGDGTPAPAAEASEK